MSTTKLKIINKFYGGIVRDDKSKIPGSASNIEEVDIFSNQDYIQAEQIMSSDSIPASTRVYDYTVDGSDNMYAYGIETSLNKVRILSLSNGGGDSPSTFSTLFTSADSTNVGYTVSPCQWHLTSESSGGYIYYCTVNGSTITLKRYGITGASESTVGTLSGLSGSYDRITMKVIFGELFITNGKYIAKVDKDGVFSATAFTLPSDWIAVDMIAVSDVSIILCRNINRLANFSRGYWWDLSSAATFDDQFDIPHGGPQWIINHKEDIKLLCAINGRGRIYKMSGAYPGASPIELPGLALNNVSTETSTQHPSNSKMVGKKDNILYFSLWKTDKSGIYALGKVDSDKSDALILSKRFFTTSYSTHVPLSLKIHGPNFYNSYIDNGTYTCTRCMSNNSPSRSSNAVYESIWLDDGNPMTDKGYEKIFIGSYPLSASTSISVGVATNYNSSYTTITRADGTSMNTVGDILGVFNSNLFSTKVVKIKISFTSNGSNSPKVCFIGYSVSIPSDSTFK